MKTPRFVRPAFVMLLASACSEDAQPPSSIAEEPSTTGLPTGPDTATAPGSTASPSGPTSTGSPTGGEPTATAPDPTLPGSSGGSPGGAAASSGGSAGDGLGGAGAGGSLGGFGGSPLGGAGGSTGGSGGVGGAAVENPEDFDESFREVAELIQTRCANLCHGGREGQEHLVNFSTERLSGFYDTLTTPLDTSLCYGEPPVVPGSVDESFILRVVQGPIEDPCVLPQMPAGCGEDPTCLSDEEVAILETWIAAGAPRDR